MADDGFLYHVTFHGRLESINEEGLRPGARRAIGGESYDFHRRGRVFLTEGAGVFYWFSMAEAWAQDGSDAPLEDGVTPAVLRIDPQYLDEEPQSDEIGTNDARREAYFVQLEISPEIIDVWNGSTWVQIENWGSIDPSSSYTVEGDTDDETGERTEWYALRADHENPLFPPELRPSFR